MAKATVFEKILSGIGISKKRRDTWSVVKIEKVLKDTGVKAYEFDFEPKVVRLANRDDLMKILMNAMPSEISKDDSLTIVEANGLSKLKLGNWMFEAKS